MRCADFCVFQEPLGDEFLGHLESLFVVVGGVGVLPPRNMVLAWIIDETAFFFF